MRRGDIHSHFGVKFQPGLSDVLMGADIERAVLHDVLPGMDVLTKGSFNTVVILMPAPPEIQNNGLTVPGTDSLGTSFGNFVVASTLRDRLRQSSPSRVMSSSSRPK